MKLTKTLLIALSLLTVLGVFSYLNNSPEKLKTNTDEVDFNSIGSSIDNRAFLEDVIESLYYHYAAFEKGTELSNLEEDFDWIDLYSSILGANKHHETGNSYMKKYADSSDMVASLVSEGMLLSINSQIETNKELIEVFKRIETGSESSDFSVDLEMAKYITNSKENYELLGIAAGQASLLIFEPAKSETPGGPIPYRISDKDRQELISLIDSRFGDSLQETNVGTGQYILIVVNIMRDNMLPDTYEETNN